MTTWKCVSCSTILDCKDCTNPNNHECPCGSESWTPIEQDKEPTKSSVAINTTNNYPSEVTQINDHIKVNIEQTAKGARVTVTYDRSDHDIQEAVNGAIQAYETTILELKERGLKVDEAEIIQTK